MMTLEMVGSASVSGSSRSGSRLRLPEEILMEKVEIQKLKNKQESEKLLKSDEMLLDDENDKIISIPTKPLHEKKTLIDDNDGTNSTKSVKDDGSSELMTCPRPSRRVLKRSKGPLATEFIDPTGPWARLGPPDLDEIERYTRSCSPDSDARAAQPQKVRFHSVQVRLYGQTLGDNPAVTNGAPIQLDWCYNEHPPIDVNLFHAGRTSRPIRQLVLSRYYRHKILIHWYNFTEDDIKNANHEAKKIRKQRQQTSLMSEMMAVEECVYSVGRVFKGMFRSK